ncbi:hypothetical protein DEA8626_02662 [Defluviimonas aquaemixtae]|uniref:Translocase n=1 Tax=Albidovulum aquaemixtae TaxID=1542388 RepID=A0A2R8BJS3_9RHOB|nr:hypothetical protein [Defluviimonas aquaemixtae]SPH23598.1 hypothetical protein DEA8626_02662 [Defluviimonas aquaemixtae]
MQLKRRAVMVGTTFFLAAATGHIMQSGDAISDRLEGIREVKAARSAPVPEPAPVANFSKAPETDAVATMAASAVKTAGTTLNSAILIAAMKSEHAAKMLPDLPTTEPRAFASADLLAARMDGLDSGYERPATDADANYSVFGIACTPAVMTLEPGARAMLKLDLTASCYPNERVTISHAGLTFAVATDLGGELELTLPAMASTARVEVRFASGEGIGAEQAVTGLGALTRVAVQWNGPADLHLNAYENGAGFGDAGHVSAESPRHRTTSEGGFLTALGDAEIDHPMLAEVYTAPAGTKLDALVLEAEVSAENCGRTLTGQTLTARTDAEPEISTLSFAMPDCSAEGEFIAMDLTQSAAPEITVALSAR